MCRRGGRPEALNFPTDVDEELQAARPPTARANAAQILFTVDLGRSAKGSGVIRQCAASSTYRTLPWAAIGEDTHENCRDRAEAILQLAVSPKIEEARVAYFNVRINEARGRRPGLRRQARQAIARARLKLTGTRAQPAVDMGWVWPVDGARRRGRAEEGD